MSELEARQLCVESRSAGMRLDRFVAAHLGSADGADAPLSRSEIQRLIGAQQITINGAAAKPSTRLKTADRILVRLLEPREPDVRAEALPLAILYEDADYIVLDKAAGITVHPAAGHWSGTLVNALLHHCPDLQGIGGIRRPGIVHRLDKDTSGVMIVAKNSEAYQHLLLQFKNRTVAKEYIALVWGWLRGESGVIDRPIGRHRSDRKKMSSRYLSSGAREALTEWRAEERFALDGAHITLVRLRPRTGRTHQLRVHLADAGHPLLGDPVYGRKRSLPNEARLGGPPPLSRQALHAHKLTVQHLRTGRQIGFTAPLAGDLSALRDYLRRAHSDPRKPVVFAAGVDKWSRLK
jgi:23S rRNA pseudouridine1911/1915/1917 synthase